MIDAARWHRSAGHGRCQKQTRRPPTQPMKIYHHLPDNKNLFRNPVVTIGNFDGVHLGHRKILASLLTVSARESGDPVVITFSAHPRKILNPEMPIHILTTTEEKINAIYD
ncbi:MAG: hypothetical protein E4G96_08475, partial [Chrysiogenales bacterium]